MLKQAFTLFLFLLLALFGVALDSALASYTGTIGVLGTGAGLTVANASGIVARLADNPELWKKWTDKTFKHGEYKTEFKESELGTVFHDDGPEQSQQVTAAPILYNQEFMNGGHQQTIRVRNPLFTEPDDVLNSGRYGDQERVGAEYKLDQQHVTTPIDLWHIAVKDTEVQESYQKAANVNNPAILMQSFSDALSEHTYQRKDWDQFVGMIAGYGLVHYQNAAKRNEVADAEKPVGAPKMGVLEAPREHPETFVYYKADGDSKAALHKVGYDPNIGNFEDNLVAEISKVDSEAKPTLDLMRYINRECIRRKMVPCQFTRDDGTRHNYYVVYTPGGIRDLLEDDDKFFKLYNNAFQGVVRDNPLLHPDDVVYKNLIIRDSNKLDVEYFGLHQSFNADGGTSSPNMSVDKVGDKDAIRISPAHREFNDTTKASAEFGGTDQAHNLKRILVMGANGGIRAVGKEFDMEPMEQTQYGKDAGVGIAHNYGTMRNESRNAAGDFVKCQQSFQVAAFAAA